MESAKLTAKQYFLYLGGFYLLMCAIGAMVTFTDTAPPKPHILEGLGYLLIKGLVMFVPGLKFKSWLAQPDRLRKAANLNASLSGLFLTAVLASGGGLNQGVLGDLFLASLGLGFVNAALREHDQEPGNSR